MNLNFKWIAIFVALFLAAAPLRAQYTETGDAGQTVATAQNSGLTQSNIAGQQVMIFGSISGINDADVFKITLTLPMQVQITTVNTLTGNSGGAGGLDTELFLFDSTGHPIYANDDANGTVVQSTLPAGTSFTLTLNAGTYLIGISLAGNEPMNSTGQLVFTSNANPAAVRGPSASLNPTTYSNFNNGAAFAQSGNYEIDIMTSAVPEPSSIALLSAGLLLSLVLFRKRVSSSQNS